MIQLKHEPLPPLLRLQQKKVKQLILSFQQRICELQVQEPIRYEKLRVNVNFSSFSSYFGKSFKEKTLYIWKVGPVRATLGESIIIAGPR